jgi:hypothetical protein
MRTYILAIATAALFAIPTAAVSESGHHRYYNRYEASTIATKADGAENCEEFACTKKN